MKIQTNRKGRGIRAILCGIVSVLCIAFGSIDVMAGYTSDNHPSVQFSPDGSAWTTVDELPYCESYDIRDYPAGYMFPFWSDQDKEIDTAIEANPQIAGVGQHNYDYERHGYIPVDYWKVNWYNGRCIHNRFTLSHDGIQNLCDLKCWGAYWSGVEPYCADCGRSVSGFIHYIKPETARTLEYINVDKRYYYLCPHNQDHLGPKLEQAIDDYGHNCEAVSYNQYMVVYKPNAIRDVDGMMEPSLHMYENANMLDGEPVVPNRFLNVNRYQREGYVFVGWNTEPDGSGQSFGDCAEILNLTTEHYDPRDVNRGPNDGVVTLYAQWERSMSHLQIDTKGGKYDDGVGEVNGDKTKYENQAYNSSMELSEEYLTAPMGYTVSFVTNCPTTIAPMQTQKIFNSWKKSEPYAGKFVDGRFQTVPSYEAGRLLNNVFEFVGENDVWSYDKIVLAHQIELYVK